MAVRLRLRREGTKKKVHFRVVAADHRSPRDGRFIEIIGDYHPEQNPSVVNIDEERALHWLRNGARPSSQVENLLRIAGIWEKFRPGDTARPEHPEEEPKESKKQQAEAAEATEAAAEGVDEAAAEADGSSDATEEEVADTDETATEAEASTDDDGEARADDEPEAAEAAEEAADDDDAEGDEEDDK